ncbi:YadA-like family protein, partial [Luteimonas sp. SJ-92]
LQGTATGYSSSAGGLAATANGGFSDASGDFATALGYGAEASNTRTTAVGISSVASGTNATALGNTSTASGNVSVAVGSSSRATMLNSTAVGGSSWATADNTTAVGQFAWATSAGSTAIGRDSYAYGGINATAVGLSAWANGANSVALGSGSRANEENVVSVGNGTGSGGYPATRRIINVGDGVDDNDAVNMAQLNSVADDLGELSDSAVVYDDDSKGTVTFAGDDGTVLTNVAAGEVSEDSTDAVNGSQLFETNQRVDVVEGQVADLDDRVGDVEGVVANAVSYDDDSRATITLDGDDGTVITNVAAGAIGAGSTDAINGGQMYGALQSAADVIGGGATVTAFGTIAAPTYSIQGANYYSIGDALGALDAQISQLDLRVSTVGSDAGNGGIGNRAAVDGAPTGNAAKVGAGSNGVAVGANATANSSNGIAVGGNAYAHGPNDTAIGGNARVEADGSTAVGANATVTAAATNAVAMGEGASVSAASGTAIGQGASATAEGAVALGQGSVADRADAVSVGSAGNERQVTNVAAGTSDTDAANVAQVRSTATETLSSANAYTDAQVAAWHDNFDAFQGDVERRFHDQDRRIDRQGAMGAAMLNMATSAAGIRTQNRVGVGVGFQGGESALSVGYQRAISDRATVTLGGAFSGDEKSVGVGAGFGW